MLLEGKKLLITGVLTRDSIAYGAAQAVQEQGGEIVLTSFGRAMGLTERSAKRLPQPVDVLEMDANDLDQIRSVHDELAKRWGRLDGLLHAIAYAPPDALGGNFLETPWESVATAVQTSAFSLKAIAVGLLPLMKENGGAIVSMDFDAQVAWPLYDWMGVCKAGLEAIVRYLARDLGPKKIRVNSLAAGPIATIAAKGIPGFKYLENTWGEQAPLGWDARSDAAVDAVARTACVLMSDWMPSTTGELIRVDGGFHAMGAKPIDLASVLAAEKTPPTPGT